MAASGGWMVEIMEEGVGGCMMNGWMGRWMDGCMHG